MTESEKYDTTKEIPYKECLGVGEMAQWFQRTGVQFLEPIRWLIAIHYHLTTSCSPGTQHPLLTSMGARHACGAQTHMQAKHPRTQYFLNLKNSYNNFLLIKRNLLSDKVLSKAIRPGNRSSITYASYLFRTHTVRRYWPETHFSQPLTV